MDRRDLPERIAMVVMAVVIFLVFTWVIRRLPLRAWVDWLVWLVRS